MTILHPHSLLISYIIMERLAANASLIFSNRFCFSFLFCIFALKENERIKWQNGF